MSASARRPAPALDHARASWNSCRSSRAQRLPYVIWAGPTRATWRPYRSRPRAQDHDTDIPRMRTGRVSAQFWAAFIPTSRPPGRSVLELVDIIIQLTENHPDVFVPARARRTCARQAARQDRLLHRHRGRGGAGEQPRTAARLARRRRPADDALPQRDARLGGQRDRRAAPWRPHAFGRAVIAELTGSACGRLAHVAHT